MVIHLKNWYDLNLTLTTTPKVKSIVPFYIPLRPKQLLSKTFFLKMFIFPDILQSQVKKLTLYTIIYNYIWTIFSYFLNLTFLNLTFCKRNNYFFHYFLYFYYYTINFLVSNSNFTKQKSIYRHISYIIIYIYICLYIFLYIFI